MVRFAKLKNDRHFTQRHHWESENLMKIEYTDTFIVNTNEHLNMFITQMFVLRGNRTTNLQNRPQKAELHWVHCKYE